MIKFKEIFGDYKQVQATVNTTSCFMDGVQFVAGTTLANHGLKIEDEKVSSVIFSKKGCESAVKVSVKESSRDFIKENYPEFAQLRESLLAEGVKKTPEQMAHFRKIALETAFKMVDNDAVENIFELEVISVPVTEK